MTTSTPRYRGGSGEPLVLIHGLTGTWRLWEPVLAQLSDRFDVLAPTLPGHDGGPEMASDTAFSLDSLVTPLEHELADQGIETAHIVGSSLGGALAIELAKRGKARSVVGLAPGFDWSPGDPDGPRLARVLARQQRQTSQSDKYLPLIMRSAPLRRRAFRYSMVHGERLQPDAAVDIARSSIRCPVAEPAIRAIKAGAAGVQDLDQVRAPTLIAWPDHDRLTPRSAHGDRYLKEISDVTYRSLPDVGHLPMFDNPKLIASTIIDWVTSH